MAKRKAVVSTAETVEQRLQELYEQNKRLTPEMVVADARDPDSILHSHFNWDVEKAANEYWLDRARQLIRSVKLVISTETVSLSCVAYVRNPELPEGEQGYVQVDQVRSDAEMARAVLVDEFAKAAAALTRARALAAVFGLMDDVEDLISNMHTVRGKVPDERRV
jgi:hypothetical protein